MKARTLFILALALTTVISLAPPALAHHSFAAEYDADKPVTLTGSVTKMAWINPHSWIYINVKKADGTLENWAIEAGPPGTLVRRAEDFCKPPRSIVPRCFESDRTWRAGDDSSGSAPGHESRETRAGAGLRRLRPVRASTAGWSRRCCSCLHPPGKRREFSP